MRKLEPLSSKVRHLFHLVDESPWPLYGSIIGFLLTTRFLIGFQEQDWNARFLRLAIMVLVMTQWWTDVSREASKIGFHSTKVEEGLRWGIILFIVSEVCFFFSFFWAFFHSSLSPNVEIGFTWPPSGISPLNPFEAPLLNSIILIRSGVRVTWAHHALIVGNYSETIKGLIVTIFLGLIFTVIQGLEYFEARFCLSDRVFGSTFYLATGFHGLHVIVGTLFLIVTLYRAWLKHFNINHHFGFEAAAWYWHFVDVVWLFLYVRIYWWGRI